MYTLKYVYVIIQYLLYLVVLVYESVCIHSAISEKMGSAIVLKNYATFL